LYRNILFLCSVAIAVFGTISAALAAESERCQELGRRYHAAKPQITAIEVSLTLFSATDANCLALATELLNEGASVDARDRLGARPLSHAARSGHIEMVDLLLARGAPIDARNLAGATALYFAAEGSHATVVQRLIERDRLCRGGCAGRDREAAAGAKYRRQRALPEQSHIADVGVGA